MFEHFYHQTIRRVVVAFGALFNDIYISRLDNNNDEVERIKVPIGYGPQQKFIRRLARIGTDFDANKVRIENYLPRLSFEISNINYDPSRKLNPMNRTVLYKNSTTVKSRYEKVPYNMDLTLGIMTKNTEDALQIIEQILPYFTPFYTITMNDIPSLDMKRDVQVTLTSVSQSDEYEGSVEDDRIITWTLTFVANSWIYPPISDSNIIKTAVTNFYELDTTQKLTTVSVEVNPITADRDDNYTIDTTIIEY